MPKHSQESHYLASILSHTFVECICRNISCALGKWSLYSRWNFISTFTELHLHGDERWPTEVTSTTYSRGVGQAWHKLVGRMRIASMTSPETSPGSRKLRLPKGHPVCPQQCWSLRIFCCKTPSGAAERSTGTTWVQHFHPYGCIAFSDLLVIQSSFYVRYVYMALVYHQYQLFVFRIFSLFLPLVQWFKWKYPLVNNKSNNNSNNNNNNNGDDNKHEKMSTRLNKCTVWPRGVSLSFELPHSGGHF